MSWTNKKSPKITKQRKGDRYHRQEQEVGSLKDSTPGLKYHNLQASGSLTTFKFVRALPSDRWG